jgi:hypothetical protein
VGRSGVARHSFQLAYASPYAGLNRRLLRSCANQQPGRAPKEGRRSSGAAFGGRGGRMSAGLATPICGARTSDCCR